MNANLSPINGAAVYDDWLKWRIEAAAAAAAAVIIQCAHERDKLDIMWTVDMLCTSSIRFPLCFRFVSFHFDPFILLSFLLDTTSHSVADLWQ